MAGGEGAARPAGGPRTSARHGRVRVTGVGQVEAAPDRLEVVLAVAVQGDTPGEALRAVSGRLEELLRLLDAHGVEPADRRTEWVSVRPHHDEMTGRPSGRHHTETALRVRVADLDAAGALLDAAGQGLGHALRVNDLRWSFGDPAPLLASARRRAVEDGAERAEALAAAAGTRLGRLRSISEGATWNPDTGSTAPFQARALAAGPRMEPGTQHLTVHVQLVYDLESGAPT